MDRRLIVKEPKKAGFVQEEGSNHTGFYHPDGRVTYVPRHRSVREGTWRAIQRQAGLDRRKDK